MFIFPTPGRYLQTAALNCMRQNIVFSYSEMIPVSFSLFLCFSLFLLLLLLFYVIIYFYKNFIIIIIIILFIYFFMLRDVPECSMFLVLSTALAKDWSANNSSRYFRAIRKTISLR